MLLIKVQSLLMSDDQESSRDTNTGISSAWEILPGILILGVMLSGFSFSLIKGCRITEIGANKMGRIFVMSMNLAFWTPECPVNEDTDSVETP